MAPPRLPLEERFWARVTRRAPDECWLWTGSTIWHGYGRMRSGGRGSKSIPVHRVSWAVHHGAIPSGLNVLHKCDVRNCVNPAHLFLGTDADNVADMVSKGRQSRLYGRANPATKLREDDIQKIRTLGETASQRAIADKFGVSQVAISKVMRGVTWSHV